MGPDTAIGLDLTLKMSVNELNDLIFGAGSKFDERLLGYSKAREANFTKWKNLKHGQSGRRKERSITMMIPVKDLSKYQESRMASLAETQVRTVEQPFSLYVVESVTSMPDITYGDMFEVHTQYVLKAVGRDKTQLRIAYRVHFLRSTSLESLISRNTLNGLMDYMNLYHKTLFEFVSSGYHNSYHSAGVYHDDASLDPRTGVYPWTHWRTGNSSLDDIGFTAKDKWSPAKPESWKVHIPQLMFLKKRNIREVALLPVLLLVLIGWMVFPELAGMMGMVLNYLAGVGLSSTSILGGLVSTSSIAYAIVGIPALGSGWVALRVMLSTLSTLVRVEKQPTYAMDQERAPADLQETRTR
jgi:hypothetical protein